MIGLGDLATGSNMSIVRGVSADGSVVAGVSNTSGGDRPFRWTAGGGFVNLGKLVGGNGHARALGISGNGSVIVGESGSTFAGIGSLEAFRWSQADGIVGLGDLMGGYEFQPRLCRVVRWQRHRGRRFHCRRRLAGLSLDSSRRHGRSRSLDELRQQRSLGHLPRWQRCGWHQRFGHWSSPSVPLEPGDRHGRPRRPARRHVSSARPAACPPMAIESLAPAAA